MWMLFLQGTYHTPAAVSYTSLAILVSLSWWYKLIEVLLPGESLASLVKGKVVCGGCDGLNSLPRTSQLREIRAIDPKSLSDPGRSVTRGCYKAAREVDRIGVCGDSRNGKARGA